MHVRDRVVELRRVRAADLRTHPMNWRTHPASQRETLEGVLREVGFADALLVREMPDGSLQLIDGHLRAEVAPEMEVPVLILDVNEAEAETLLATLDPLAALAHSDAEVVERLHERVRTDESRVAELLAEVRRGLEKAAASGYAESSPKPPPELTLGGLYQVVVECADEGAQRELYERLTGEGHKCRALVL